VTGKSRKEKIDDLRGLLKGSKSISDIIPPTTWLFFIHNGIYTCMGPVDEFRGKEFTEEEFQNFTGKARGTAIVFEKCHDFYAGDVYRMENPVNEDDAPERDNTPIDQAKGEPDNILNDRENGIVAF
jgi:hypothetical protein